MKEMMAEGPQLTQNSMINMLETMAISGVNFDIEMVIELNKALYREAVLSSDIKVACRMISVTNRLGILNAEEKWEDLAWDLLKNEKIDLKWKGALELILSTESTRLITAAYNKLL